MNTQQKTQQKLADIHMLVSYIKEHMDTKPVESENTRLDEIGKTTLEIASVLKLVENKTGPEAEAVFTSYRDAIDNMSDIVLKKLSDIRDLVDTNSNTTTALYERVEEVYVSYAGILESSSKQLELQRENYAKELHRTAKNIQEVTDITEKLNQKVMTEEDMSNLLSGIETRLEKVITEDNALNKTYEENIKRINQKIDRIQKTYRNLDDTLLSVDESIKEAVGRMNVLLMQAEVLTGERGRK